MYTCYVICHTMLDYSDHFGPTPPFCLRIVSVIKFWLKNAMELMTLQTRLGPNSQCFLLQWLMLYINVQEHITWYNVWWTHWPSFLGLCATIVPL